MPDTACSTPTCDHSAQDRQPCECCLAEREHRCARHNRCADRERLTDDDGKRARWVGARLQVHRGLCVSCVRIIDQSLPHLVGDYVELATLLGEHSGTSEDVIRFSRDLPIPIRLAVKTLQEALVVECDTWIEPVCERLGIESPTTREQARTKPQVRLVRAVRILANSVSVLLALPEQEVPAWDKDGLPAWDDTFDCQDVDMLDGTDAALRLLRLHEMTRIVAGRGELVHKLAAPCPRCNRLTLVRDNGCDDVHCRACRDRWTEKDYKRLCLVLASDEHRRIKLCGRCDKRGLLPNRRVCDHQPVEVVA